MKLNEDYFFCFGCGAKGDVIDFVAKLFDLSSYEAAQKRSVRSETWFLGQTPSMKRIRKPGR